MKAFPLIVLAGLCLPTHAALLPDPLGSVLAPILPGPQKFLLHLDAAGARQGWTADGAGVFRLSGKIYAGSPVGPTGTVAAGYGTALGNIVKWTLNVKIDGGAVPYNNLDTRISCAPCRIALNDGGVLEVIYDNPATPLPEVDIPMNARLLPELGQVSTADTQSPVHQRIAGCVGLREIAGRGKLAFTQGTLCLNGVLKLPYLPVSASGFNAIFSLGLESDATLTMQQILSGALAVQ